MPEYGKKCGLHARKWLPWPPSSTPDDALAHVLTWDCGMQSSSMVLVEKYDGMILYGDDDDEHRKIANRS
jgi:hypothetical protein